jgi:hypothetical protein
MMDDEEYKDWATLYERRAEVAPDLEVEKEAFGQVDTGDQFHPGYSPPEKVYNDAEIAELDKIRKNGITIAAENEDEDDFVSGQVRSSRFSPS